MDNSEFFILKNLNQKIIQSYQYICELAENFPPTPQETHQLTSQKI